MPHSNPFVGTHNYTLIVYDTSGLSTASTIWVTITPHDSSSTITSPTTSPTSTATSSSDSETSSSVADTTQSSTSSAPLNSPGFRFWLFMVTCGVLIFARKGTAKKR